MTCLKVAAADREPPKASLFHTSPAIFPPPGEDRREAGVCDLVDECQMIIRHRIDTFFAACLAKVAPWVDNLLDCRRAAGQTPFCDAILPQRALDALVEELRLVIKSKAEGYFGVTPLAGIAKIDLALRRDVQLLQGLFAEYRRTLLVMHLAAAISNRACEQSINGLKASFLLETVLDELELGSKVLDLAKCCPRKNRPNYRQVMMLQVSGMLQTLRRQLAKDACYQAAACFYELYDRTGGQRPGLKRRQAAKAAAFRAVAPQDAARALA
jgi:hypothetical protein